MDGCFVGIFGCIHTPERGNEFDYFVYYSSMLMAGKMVIFEN